MTTDLVSRALIDRARQLLRQRGLSNNDRRRLQTAIDNLREAVAKVHVDPASANRPNAPSPDVFFDDSAVFRAPPELIGFTIHTSHGVLDVPFCGIVRTNPQHKALHKELLGRGFVWLTGVDRFGKTHRSSREMAKQDALALFRKSNLPEFNVLDPASRNDTIDTYTYPRTKAPQPTGRISPWRQNDGRKS